MRVVSSLPLSLILLCAVPALAAPAAPDAKRLEALTGMKASVDAAEGVVKVSLPRPELGVAVGAVKLTPPQGLTAWAAFMRAGDQLMVMGDLVLTEDQVAPVMDAAFEAGLEVTALHNHFLGDAPRVMFMHVGGHGPEEALGRAIGKVFARLREPGPKPALPAIDAAHSTLDRAALEKVLGPGAEVAPNGVVRFVWGRKAQMMGHPVGKAMGVNTWAAFGGTAEAAVVDGDFAMTEGELQGVLRALRKGGLQITAIHNHMTGETPRIVFLHYFGTGPAATLARALRAGLDVLPK